MNFAALLTIGRRRPPASSRRLGNVYAVRLRTRAWSMKAVRSVELKGSLEVVKRERLGLKQALVQRVSAFQSGHVIMNNWKRRLPLEFDR